MRISKFYVLKLYSDASPDVIAVGDNYDFLLEEAREEADSCVNTIVIVRPVTLLKREVIEKREVVNHE